MTPDAAISHVLDSIDGLLIDGSDDDVIGTLLSASIAIAGIALLRIDHREREAVLFGLERGVREYVNLVLACRTPSPAAANGHGNGHD